MVELLLVTAGMSWRTQQAQPVHPPVRPRQSRMRSHNGTVSVILLTLMIFLASAAANCAPPSAASAMAECAAQVVQHAGCHDVPQQPHQLQLMQMKQRNFDSALNAAITDASESMLQLGNLYLLVVLIPPALLVAVAQRCTPPRRRVTPRGPRRTAAGPQRWPIQQLYRAIQWLLQLIRPCCRRCHELLGWLQQQGVPAVWARPAAGKAICTLQVQTRPKKAVTQQHGQKKQRPNAQRPVQASVTRAGKRNSSMQRQVAGAAKEFGTAIGAGRSQPLDSRGPMAAVGSLFCEQAVLGPCGSRESLESLEQPTECSMPAAAQGYRVQGTSNAHTVHPPERQRHACFEHASKRGDGGADGCSAGSDDCHGDRCGSNDCHGDRCGSNDCHGDGCGSNDCHGDGCGSNDCHSDGCGSNDCHSDGCGSPPVVWKISDPKDLVAPPLCSKASCNEAVAAAMASNLCTSDSLPLEPPTPTARRLTPCQSRLERRDSSPMSCRLLMQAAHSTCSAQCMSMCSSSPPASHSPPNKHARRRHEEQEDTQAAVLSLCGLELSSSGEGFGTEGGGTGQGGAGGSRQGGGRQRLRCGKGLPRLMTSTEGLKPIVELNRMEKVRLTSSDQVAPAMMVMPRGDGASSPDHSIMATVPYGRQVMAPHATGTHMQPTGMDQPAGMRQLFGPPQLQLLPSIESVNRAPPLLPPSPPGVGLAAPSMPMDNKMRGSTNASHGVMTDDATPQQQDQQGWQPALLPLPEVAACAATRALCGLVVPARHARGSSSSMRTRPAAATTPSCANRFVYYSSQELQPLGCLSAASERRMEALLLPSDLLED
jgi:hypothetical protein